MNSSQDTERNIEFEFVRATENAALNSIHWLGRGNKEAADEAACDAINGVFDLVDIRGEVVIGEGIKDNAPGIFLGDRLGTWAENAPRFDIALDPIDGTSNIAKGLPNSISVMAAAHVPNGNTHGMVNIPSFYCEKLSYGPGVREAIAATRIPPLSLDMNFGEVMTYAAAALHKRISELVVVMLDHPRNQKYLEIVRQQNAALRLISDGDIAAAVAPSLPDSGVDLYVGIGGAPEGILTAAALKALGGELHIRMWPRDDAERTELLRTVSPEDLDRPYATHDLVLGESAIFCATGISDSPLLPGVKLVGNTATTHSILMRARSQTVRYIRAVHNLSSKTIHLRSIRREAAVQSKAPGPPRQRAGGHFPCQRNRLSIGRIASVATPRSTKEKTMQSVVGFVRTMRRATFALGMLWAGGLPVSAQTPVTITVTTLGSHIATFNNVHLPGVGSSNEGLGGFQVDLTSINGVSVNLAPHATFCTELGENISATSYTAFEIVQLPYASAGTAGDIGTPSESIPLGGIGFQSAAEMRYLFDHYYLSEDLANWTTQQSQAFQLAVWEIGHDPQNLNIVDGTSGGGVFYVPFQNNTTRDATIALAQTMLNAVAAANVNSSYVATTVNIWSLADDNGVNATTGFQDILFATFKTSQDGQTSTPLLPPPIPEPTTLALALGGVVLLRRRRR